MLLEEGEGCVRMNSGAVLFYLMESAIAIRELNSLSPLKFIYGFVGREQGLMQEAQCNLRAPRVRPDVRECLLSGLVISLPLGAAHILAQL